MAEQIYGDGDVAFNPHDFLCGYPGCQQQPSLVSTGSIISAPEDEHVVGWEFHMLACEEHVPALKKSIETLVERLRGE